MTGKHVTDRQLDKLIGRLDRRLMRLRAECDEAINELADIISSLKTTRAERDEYRERWLRS